MADLLAFDIQAKSAQTQQKAVPSSNSSSKNDNNSKRAGFFDSLVNEYSAPKDVKSVNSGNAVKTESNENDLTAFNGKLFSNSVMEILADENPEELLNVADFAGELKNSLVKVKDSMPEVLYDDGELNLNEEISEILAMNDDELNALLESLPEDLRSEVKNLINEINKALENGGNIAEIEASAEKLSDLILISKHENKIKPEAEKISDDDSDDDEEIKTDGGQAELNAANNAGLASVQNDGNKIVDAEPKTENAKDFDVKDSNQRKDSKIPVQNQNQNVQDENKTETQAEPEQKFRNLIRDRAEENSQSESENGNQNQDSDFNQGENFFDRQQDSGSRNQSRSRNDNRRISNDNSLDYERNQTANRTDTRNDFQSFFDGILNSRGTSSANSAQPLSLRGNLNLNQSETLREGLTNVVRFIRADGIQKASVIIDPPALGRISVELTSSSSGVEASIKVASEQIRQLVQDQLTQLRMNLAEQGVQVAEFTVDVQQDNQFSGNSQNQEQQDGRENFTAEFEDDDDTEEFRVDLEEGLLYWVA